MTSTAGRLTERKALAFPLPDAGYAIHWCPQAPGFGVRVTAAGARSWISERRVNGKTVRRTIGKAAGRGAISADTARSLMVDISSELQRGIDRNEDQRAERAERAKQETDDANTLAVAIKVYVEKKRRGKDGLPLKARTRADYLEMVEPGGTTKTGKPRADGELHALADRPITKITGDDMRRVYAAALKRGSRRATYCMQVLRAVLNWFGMKVPGNPLSADTAGRDRIVLPPTKGAPQPIPPEGLGAWWRAAGNAGRASDQIGGSADAADALKFLLLTGCRPGEVFPGEHEPGLFVRDVDLNGARFKLTDTKNRTDHYVLLSTQALEIAHRHAKGKTPDEPLFAIQDPGKTLDAICTEAEVQRVTAHKLRHTFASIAEELVSAAALKRMLNHTAADDVTQAHYIGKSETQMRAAWQTVADFIEEAAAQ